MDRRAFLSLWEPGGINFDSVFRGLHEIGYTGYFTVHSRTSQANTPIDLATKTFAFLKPYADGTEGYVLKAGCCRHALHARFVLLPGSGLC
jgi:hypothetical protein